MSDSPKSPIQRFQVAVFPLTHAVLFPGVTLPLQLTHPFNEQMLQDIQTQRLSLALSLIIPKPGEGFTLSPICGAGSVQIFQKHSNGNSDVLVHGEKRVRLCALLQTEPYYLMEAESVDPKPEKEASTEKNFIVLKGLMKAWVFLNPKIKDEWTTAFDRLSGFGELTDFFVFHFLKSPLKQQDYLDCTNPIERSEKLVHFLEQDLIRLSQRMERVSQYRVLH
jgi:Lon protease-like protein